MGVDSYGCFIKGQVVTGGSNLAALIAVLSPRTGSADIYATLAAAVASPDIIANLPIVKNAQRDIALWEKVFNYFGIAPAAVNLADLLAEVLAHDEDEEGQTAQTPEGLPPPVLTEAEQNELSVIAALLENVKIAGEFTAYGAKIPRGEDLPGLPSLNKIAAYLGVSAAGTDDEVKTAISAALFP